jgi:hypothetical protein
LSSESGRSGRDGASGIFTAGMVILVAKRIDRLHDLGLETKSELNGAIHCKDTSISVLCTTAKAVVSLEQTWIKRSLCCENYENAGSSAEWSKEFMALPMKCALFLSH